LGRLFQHSRRIRLRGWLGRIAFWLLHKALYLNHILRHKNGSPPTLYYFPEGPRQGDVDNIVKLALDALSPHIYLDDSQIERVVVQKFEPGNVFRFSNPSAMLLDAITGAKPVLYVRLSDQPFEDLT
jgi:hypothetical protein